MVEIISFTSNPINTESYSYIEQKRIGFNIEVEFLLFNSFVCKCEFQYEGAYSLGDIKAYIENKIKEDFNSFYTNQLLSNKTDIRDLRIGDFVKVTKPGGYCKVGDIVEVFSISKEGINHYKDMGASGFIPIEGFEYSDKSEQQLEGKPNNLKTK